MMLGLLDEFTKIYSDRLQRVEDTAMKLEEKEYLSNKVCVLEGWVRDLGEQNAVLVVTVEELEREAARRVALLEDRLTKMAVTTRQSCLSLRDHQLQVSSLVHDKIDLEKEAQGLREKLLSVERRNTSLMEDNANLHSDLSNLLQVISRARQTGQWEVDDLTFSCVTPEQVFGPVLSSSRRSSPSLKESHSDYFHHLGEDHGLKKGSSSSASSYSNLQDAESSSYGGRGSEKDLIIMKLKAEVHGLQSAQERANRQIVERDRQIVDLQTQLTQSQLPWTSSGKLSRTELHHETRKGYVEAELSNNIDSLLTRLREVEEECRSLRDTNRSLQDKHQSLQDDQRTLQDSYASCSSSNTTLQNKLVESQKALDELRLVLTAEVAQRHDQIVALGDELKTQEQQQHESQMQLQLKAEVIKELRKEIKVMREDEPADSSNTDENNTLVEGVDSEVKKMNSSNTQANEIFTSTSKTQMMDEDISKLPVNGVCSLDQASRLSKLENEVAEKSVLLRELQSHLAASRQELHLKDETLFKLEQKLDTSRREGGEKGERMHYLTGQLTNLQLEVGRTHGQVEQLRRQVENKTDLIRKLESENSSLTQQLNDKSSMLERFQNQLLNHSTELDRKKKEVYEQRLTISALQDALVSSKRACDQLRCRLDPDVSAGMMTQGSLPSKPVCASQPPSHPSPSSTKSIILPSNDCPNNRVPSACTDSYSVNAPASSFQHHELYSSSANDGSQNLVSDNHEDVLCVGKKLDGNVQNCSATKPIDVFCNASKTEVSLPPDVRPASQCDQENHHQSSTSAFTPDVLSSCGSNTFEVRSSQQEGENPSVVILSQMMSKSISNNINFVDGKINMERPQSKCQSGQVYDV
ncbi:hypothetical protein Pcinc_021607 [Petrolisthes cinctipes]|uniref:Uncharacterized protein n=1 Tax=Petrolisthes cinctipes TaxID=88211 RepID=A0AAE1FG42_PETCI|nr:hypothetical protein Pcinc_021607 [Petrolisthes cinctipes]